MVAAEPINARIFRKRAKSSTTKLPPKLSSLPPGNSSRITPAATKSAIAEKSTTHTGSPTRNAPSISSAMAPSASTISGKSGTNAGSCAAFMILPRHQARQACRLHAMERVMVVVDQLRHRDRGKVEHRLRIDADQDRENDERREDDHFAPAKVLDPLQVRLLELAEDHLAVQPQHVAGREDGAERGERRHTGVDAERADQRQELADEARGARQPDIAERKHQEHKRIDRHAVDQPAIGRDLARMHAVVDDADTQE